MKPSLYTSAMKGDVAELEHHKDVLDKELTPNQNTVLHVAAQFGQVCYLEEVLKACPFSLLIQRNVKGETPLHIAAREGRAEIVEALIACAKRLEEELESGLDGAVKEMLRATNVDGDTALHMAVRNCHLEEANFLGTVKFLTKGLDSRDDGALLEYLEMESKVNREEGEEIMRKIKVDVEEVKEVMRATEVDRDTALHMVARNRCEKGNTNTYLKVVQLLSKEDAEFRHLPNNFQETPLYLAAERGIMGVAIVDTLVETYKSSLTYSGPGGRTALHAAALKDSTGRSTKKLLEWKKDLINQADVYGWIPLHYAACNSNAKGAVKELLSIDQSVAYITTKYGVGEQLAMDTSVAHITTTNKDDLETTLHIAAAHGHICVMEGLLSYNPDCWEMVNSKGRNVLHIAVEMNREPVIKFILDKYSWVGQLINQKDNEGNTPLHLLISSDCNVYELWKHPRADHFAFNHKNMTPVDLAWSSFIEERMSTFAATYITDWDSEICGGRNIACKAHENLANMDKACRNVNKKRKEAEQQRKEAEQQSKEAEKREEEAKNQRDDQYVSQLITTLIVVATLIATITFTAAFAIPGGYDGNQGRDQGMAVLARQVAFKVFVVTNTMAMICSVTVIFLCLLAMMYCLDSQKADIGEEAVDHYAARYLWSLILIIISMFFLMIAFIAATFAMLAHAIALAIFTCIIVSIPLLAYILELKKYAKFALA